MRARIEAARQHFVRVVLNCADVDRAGAIRARGSTPASRRCAAAILVLWKLDRLGRDLRHLVNLVGDLTKREIGLKVLAGEGASIDTTTAKGRLIFAIFASLAEFRARADHRTHPRRPCVSTREGTPRRTAIQNDAGEAAPCSGGDGQAGDESRRAMRRTRHYLPDALWPRYTQRQNPAGRRKAATESTIDVG